VSWRTLAAWIATTLGVLLLGMLIATRCLVTPGVVAGRSMEPALLPGDRVLVDRWTYGYRDPRVGEIVLLEGPSGRPMVKRVSSLREPRAADGLWVVGDNVAHSADSRQFGPLPATRLRGRVVCRYWPPSRAGPVR
jgi:signal peptidase I